MIDVERLRSSGQDLRWIRRMVVVASTESTNDDARALAAAGAPDGTVVLAAHQTAGRGRMGRSWHSPPGLGVYVSVLFRPREAPERVGRYALASAVATCRACREVVGDAVGVKWPNDVMAGRRKLAGILSEARTGKDGLELVVGIGVNVHQRPQDFSADLLDRAVSLRILAEGAPLDGDDFAARLLRALGEDTRRLREGGWDGVASRFLAYAPAIAGARVRLATGTRGVTGGLDPSGALRVVTEHGIVLVHAGESVTPEEV